MSVPAEQSLQSPIRPFMAMSSAQLDMPPLAARSSWPALQEDAIFQLAREKRLVGHREMSRLGWATKIAGDCFSDHDVRDLEDIFACNIYIFSSPHMPIYL